VAEHDSADRHDEIGMEKGEEALRACPSVNAGRTRLISMWAGHKWSILQKKPNPSSTGKMLLVWGIVAIVIVVTIGIVYFTAQSFLGGATSSAPGGGNGSAALGTLKVEEARLVVAGGPASSPCAPPSSCGGQNQSSFDFIIRNTESLSVSGLKVELGNMTMKSPAPSLPPGQVYVGSIAGPAYPVCSYQPLTISGTLSNQTSIVLNDKVLATVENGTDTCSGDDPLALSSNQVIVPVNSTDLSAWPGNLVWSVQAKDAASQKVAAGYATLLMTEPTNSNGTGYQSVAMGLGPISSGESESVTASAFINSNCCTVVTFHVELANGTSVDFSTTPKLIKQGYYKTFIIDQPGAGELVIHYIFPNTTSSSNNNMTSLLTVTNLSSPSTGTGGIYITTTAGTGSPSGGAVSGKGSAVSINMTIGDTLNAAPGVYLITYPEDVCPGIIFVVGTAPSYLPSIPSQSGCMASQTVPGAQQPRSVLGFTTRYLPEEVNETQSSSG
jgi:hypothetical protein